MNATTSQNALPLQDARKNLSEIIGKALFANESTIITRSGKNAAVVISYEDYQRYRELEDKFDGELATERLSQNNKRYSLKEARELLGLNEKIQ